MSKKGRRHGSPTGPPQSRPKPFARPRITVELDTLQRARIIAAAEAAGLSLRQYVAVRCDPARSTVVVGHRDGTFVICPACRFENWLDKCAHCLAPLDLAVQYQHFG